MDPTPSSAADQPPYRQQFNSYGAWHKQARRYINRTAPASVRIFIRNTNPGNNWRRFVLPLVFVLLGGIFLWGSWVAHRDYQLLTGPDGAIGELTVVDAYTTKKSGRASEPELRLIVQLPGGRAQSVKGSYDNDDTAGIDIGSQVRVFYADGTMPLASWAGNDEEPSDGASMVFAFFGLVVVGGAIWLLIAYKGSVIPRYMTYALAELEAGRTPMTPTKATKSTLEF